MTQQLPPPLNIDQSIQQAVTYHRAGQLQDAERLYRAILQVQPNHSAINHNLGILAVQAKQPAVSLSYFKLAFDANPSHEQFLLSYLDALIQTGQFDLAGQVLAQGRQHGLQGEAVDAQMARLNLSKLKIQPQIPISASFPDSQAPTIRSIYSSLNPDNLQTIQAASFRHTWKGVGCIKNPFDFALYWMLVWQTKPRTIIELGSRHGGSALWLADMLTCYNISGGVVSVDINPVAGVHDDRINFLTGDVSDLGKILSPSFMEQLPRPWLVIEDASHMFHHTLAILEFFHPLLRTGEYIVVEDGIVDSLGIATDFHGGPNRALTTFLTAHPDDYTLDSSYCDFWGYNMTYNTNGYLVRR